MCGISVILALQKQDRWKQDTSYTPPYESPSERGINFEGGWSLDNYYTKTLARELDESLDLISHRGPDSRGQWINSDRSVALGHVRLAINDLSPDGAQPFHDDTGSIHAVVNGEIYDADRIREELIESMGYVFTGLSDGEVVVALYKKHGISFLRYLRGEFSLCLYDSETKFFLAARDRYGIKPLFWTVSQGRLLLASEAKAFLPLGWKPEWDVKCLMDDGWRHDQRTPFKGVNKVRPGHYLTYNAAGSMEMRQYWDLDFPDKMVIDPRSEDEIVEGVRSRLLESVRLRMRADVPVGVYLSGGLDSSAIAGMMCHLKKNAPKSTENSSGDNSLLCFTIAFDEDSGMDESDIAVRTAEHLGAKLIKKHMNEEAIAQRFEQAVWHSEHQNYDLNFVGKYALSEAPHELGMKVFGGYQALLSDILLEKDHSAPQTLFTEEERQIYFKEASNAASEYYKGRALTHLKGQDSLASLQLNKISSINPMASYTFPFFAPWTEFYGKSDPRLTIAHNVDGRVRQLMVEKWHPLHSALYIWSKGNLPNVLLACLGDRSEMAHSIEGRVPFLDHEVTEYVNHVRPSLKIRHENGNKFTEKWLLRAAMKDFVTDEVYRRKKHGYAAPTKWKINGPLHNMFRRLLTKENVERLGFVDWKRVKGLVHAAFEEHDTTALRCVNVVGQWVVLSQKFGIKPAEL
ncbi:hypothetical protein ACMFMG_004306 [Clarireedia jacksonii]